MRQETDYKLPSNSSGSNGEARGDTQEQLRWSRTSPAALRRKRRPPAKKLAKISNTRTRRCLPRSSRFEAGSETTNQSLGFFFGTVWNDGIDSSITTHGNLSSRKIAFCGANGVGSSSDAIVRSIISDSLLSSKNKCVPQHAANERSRFVYAILRGSPFVRIRSLRGTDPHCTYGAPALRRQSMQ